jgi:hypothetical protein
MRIGASTSPTREGRAERGTAMKTAAVVAVIATLLLLAIIVVIVLLAWRRSLPKEEDISIESEIETEFPEDHSVSAESNADEGDELGFPEQNSLKVTRPSNFEGFDNVFDESVFGAQTVFVNHEEHNTFES